MKTEHNDNVKDENEKGKNGNWDEANGLEEGRPIPRRGKKGRNRGTEERTHGRKGKIVGGREGDREGTKGTDYEERKKGEIKKEKGTVDQNYCLRVNKKRRKGS